MSVINSAIIFNVLILQTWIGQTFLMGDIMIIYMIIIYIDKIDYILIKLTKVKFKLLIFSPTNMDMRIQFHYIQANKKY